MNFVGYLSSPWVYWTLTSTYVLSIITVIGVVIGENRNPLKSLAWVTVLLLLPAVGLVLYLFFGRSIKKPAYDLSQKQASAPQAGAVQQRSAGIGKNFPTTTASWLVWHGRSEPLITPAIVWRSITPAVRNLPP